MTREEAIKYLSDLLNDEYAFNAKDRECFDMAIEALKEAPRIHSHWEIAIGYDPKKKVQCQNCQLMNYEVTQHCPHCGAIMDGKDDAKCD